MSKEKEDKNVLTFKVWELCEPQSPIFRGLMLLTELFINSKVDRHFYNIRKQFLDEVEFYDGQKAKIIKEEFAHVKPDEKGNIKLEEPKDLEKFNNMINESRNREICIECDKITINAEDFDEKCDKKEQRIGDDVRNVLEAFFIDWE